MSGEVCNCWTDDIWRFIHTIARVSPIQSIQEKGAFLCLILSLNRIISCTYVAGVVNEFLVADQEKVDSIIPRFSEYSSSNERLFKWTYYLRQAINQACGLPTASFEELYQFFTPSSITKDVWGPVGWRILHIVPLRAKMVNGSLPASTQKALKAFITCIALLLPCSACKKHAWQYYSTHSIDEFLSNNFHVFQWTVGFHNEVNKRLNKDTGTAKKEFSAEEAMKLYVHMDEGFNLASKFK